MKIKSFIGILASLFCLVACEEWTEPEPKALDDTSFHPLTPEQEKDLIAYKNSDHKIFFAWYNYSPATPSM